ncbi:MAG: MoaD/ThiS family protein [Candidatus Brockarchaeota archaeon]|nr:MoaD/ThiS family protein [Candidatus Brockarchaeota archaeon]MBO3831880.1 MoaD/ThiS family protein [Candidatus Brockarchaeota archaeon]MBO3840857.1 MoaD/ThiS family protein [Candidatus Brockarchaeota archaeon]
MKILVKYFASYREAVGKYEEELELTPGSTIKEVLEEIVSKHPGVEVDKEAIIVLNQKIVRDNPEVKEGDVLAIFPPLGGG